VDTRTIINEVRSALERDPRIGYHGRGLKVGLEPDGNLILEGELASIAAKKLALRHAAAVPGVSAIIDRLRITPSKQMADGAIRDHVRDALLQEPALDQCGIRTEHSGQWQAFKHSTATPPCSIDVAVADGVVTLNGQVSSLSEKRLAGVLAWWVPGSCDVINGLEVAPVQEDSDDEITEAVKLVLEKDPLVNASRVRIRSRNSEVTLEGLVTNDSEKEMVEMDTWYVIGVDRVNNQLECER